MATNGAPPSSVETSDSLLARIEELEAERRRLVTTVELFRELSSALTYRDIVQAVARRLGHALSLDRCSVFLVERSRGTVHLVASFEDPSLRGHVIDLARYPELRRALDTGEVVHIPDAALDPALDPVRAALAGRQVRSIAVVPLTWRGAAIGALFLRTSRSRAGLDPGELEWAGLVAEVAANALRGASRLERLETRLRGGQSGLALDRERAALLTFLRGLLSAFAEREARADDALVPRAGEAELERLVGVALRVLERDVTT
jgi:GAF domain-containing protein